MRTFPGARSRRHPGEISDPEQVVRRQAEDKHPADAGAPRWRVWRSRATVLSQPKISSTRLRARWLSVRLRSPELNGHAVRLTDLTGPARYDRDGSDLASRGLYLDLLPWGATMSSR